MLKRILACFCSFLVVFSFCCQCFVVSADSGFHGGGGAGNRGEYYTSTRSEPDTSAKVSSMFGIDWSDENDRSNLFHYCLGLAGAVFSDDTTVKSVYNQFRAIYGSDDSDTIEKIFYVGKDGQLYFTDDFLSQFRGIVDEVSFNQGVFSVPFLRNEKIYQLLTGYGNLRVTNAVTSCLSGNDARVMAPQLSTGMGYSLVDLGFPFSDFNVVASFSSYSDYRNFYNSSISTSSTSAYSGPFYFTSNSSDGNVIYHYNDNPQLYHTKIDSDGTFHAGDPKYAHNTSSSDTRFTVRSGYDVYCLDSWFFIGVGSFEAYRSVDWLKFYTSGGTGVIRANTYYAFDNKQDADNIMGRDWKKYYQGLQYAYKDLAKGVAAGNKTLKEVNQTLSDEILGTVADISQDVAQQTNYLKKILDEIKSISGKLTYSNVVETVSAASNLLSAVCDVLDSLFSSDDGVFSLLDFVETYVLDGTGKTIASVMQTVFPFSLPHDFYLILELLSVNPETPQVHFKFDLARLGMSYDYSYTANDFEKLAYMTRFFSSVGFVLLLINFTNKILKK